MTANDHKTPSDINSIFVLDKHHVKALCHLLLLDNSRPFGGTYHDHGDQVVLGAIEEGRFLRYYINLLQRSRLYSGHHLMGESWPTAYDLWHKVAVWWGEQLENKDTVLASLESGRLPDPTEYIRTQVKENPNHAIAAKAMKAGARPQWVTGDGYTKLPDIMIRDLGVPSKGAEIWFLKGQNGWEAWREDTLQEMLSGGKANL